MAISKQQQDISLGVLRRGKKPEENTIEMTAPVATVNHVCVVPAAELKSLREDAERWRFLKSQKSFSVYPDGGEWMRVDGSKFICTYRLVVNGTVFSPYADLDTTIDAARLYFTEGTQGEQK